MFLSFNSWIKAEWEAPSGEEQTEKARVVETRYLEAGADHVIADIRGMLKLMDLEAWIRKLKERAKPKKGFALTYSTGYSPNTAL